MNRSQEVAARRAEVARLWEEGLTAPEIVERLGVSRATVSMDIHHLRQTGHHLSKRRRSQPNTRVSARRERVARLWNAGRTQTEITQEIGVRLSTIQTDLRWLRLSGQAQPHDPHDHPDRVARRQEVARLWNAGHKADEIAARLGIRRSTLYEDIDRLRRDGHHLAFRIPALKGNQSQRGGSRD